MAAVTRVKARPAQRVGYVVNEKGTAGVALTAGDLLVITGATGDTPTWGLAPAGTIDADGIALQDYAAGQGGISVGIKGEMAGFSGLTPGTRLWPSATVAGGIDTTKPVQATPATSADLPVPAVPRIKAITATTIRYNFV